MIEKKEQNGASPENHNDLNLIDSYTSTVSRFIKVIINFPKKSQQDLKKIFSNSNLYKNGEKFDFKFKTYIERKWAAETFSRRDLLKLSGLLTLESILNFLFLNRAQAGGLIPFAFIKNANASQPYVDDVFSTYIYTPVSGPETFNNGIDLASKGGLVWIKNRQSTYNYYLVDTARGVGNYLSTNTLTASTVDGSGNNLTSFNSNGFSLDISTGGGLAKATNEKYVSWTFRKSTKFFDIVTWTGNGSSGRVLNHSLGIAPGMIVIKRTDSASSVGWVVWHRSATGDLWLNLSNAQAGSFSQITGATSSTFTIGSGVDVNANGGTYVAYIYAHDTSANGIIQCGSFTTDASGNASVNLGWEPQYVVIKRTDNAGNWIILDVLRGWTANSTANVNPLYANLSNAEGNGNTNASPNSTGFNITSLFVSGPGIYLAIRRPNKPPTSGTQVYNAVALSNGSDAAGSNSSVGFPADMLFARYRGAGVSPIISNCMSGIKGGCYSNSTAAETSDVGFIESLTMNGFNWLAGDIASNSGWPNKIFHFFRRAPGVFDVVAYSIVTQTATVLNHALNAVPELIIVKQRTANNTAQNWGAYYGPYYNNVAPYTQRLRLNTTDQAYNAIAVTNATTTTFTLGLDNEVTQAGESYIAYLFASKVGISKVGNYTGDGTTNGSKVISCAFTTGARFIMIKQTDTTGDWFVWDTARGITNAGNDPHFSINTVNAEATTDNSIEPDNSGFIVVQNATTNINVSGGKYLFLAIA
ncbi:MAG: DUF7483 domain-containing protein [Pseudobdellovibrionaceae bacterium]